MLAELFSGFQWGPDTLAVLGVFGIPIVSVVCYYWHKISKDTSDNELKRSMVERGMSADEIERIMSARSPSDKR